MFENDDLKNHLETSSTIKSQSAIVAEWNMNIPTNIDRIGNYRYRPTDIESKYNSLPNTFDSRDEGLYYTGATDADTIIDNGFDDDGLPTTLTLPDDKTKMLYSLEDCFRPFRPRSGINKARLIPGSFFHHANPDMAKRPRYYMPDKNDKFKYWSSFRSEAGVQHGITTKLTNNQYYIDDAIPFVVYKEKLPANRIVIKMQTHVGSVDMGTFSNVSESFSDPFYGDSKKSTPVKWKVQALRDNNWVDVLAFNQSTKRKDGTDIIKSDGYVELAYGLKVPSKYTDIFIYAENISSTTVLPEKSSNGYAYLITPNKIDLGVFHIWIDSTSSYEQFLPEYGWYLQEETVDRLTNFVTDLTDPIRYTSLTESNQKYREFEYLQGIRLVTETMNKSNAMLEIIEISPRLSVNLSDKVISFSINKSASDLGVSGMPVSQLLASTGSLSIFDYDDAFNENNTSSIVKDYISRYIQIKIYEIVGDVLGYDYYIPIKTMYSDGFPKIDNSSKTVEISLKDLYFYLDSITAPEMLLTQASVSSAVALLLDSIGFSNYVFKRVVGEKEHVIPYFFIPPNKTVAEILEDIAVSTQTAMFFDEYNNFVMMSKGYMMPTPEERATDITLFGSLDMEESGVIKNRTTKSKLANIIQVTSQDNHVYNDGKINYTSRYIQKSFDSIKQASMIDRDKSWIYKPVLLWEVSGSENTKSINNEIGDQSSYMLSAIPLNSDLSAALPTVSGNKVKDNTMDLGEGVYWISRYNGYFYSSGEIIKFDAVQYNVAEYGNVWISNVEEYQNYFSKLKFNGKIYPTGLVRIYSEPNYETVNDILKLKNGAVAKHGRGQFGTTIVVHTAGLNPYWYDNANVRGCTMDSSYIFSNAEVSTDGIPKVVGAAGINNVLARSTTRNELIKNFLSSSYVSETGLNAKKSTQAGSVQSSALVMSGPSFLTTEKGIDFVSYVNKPLSDKYTHFGTRMRIIGKIENNLNRGQTASGSSLYYVVPGRTPDENVTISGGSGGLAVMINPSTNNGYYFEIVALGSTDIDPDSNVSNIVFYKIMNNPASPKALPIKLWEGLGKIIVDDGKFTGQSRMANEQDPTVYDLAVEYTNIGNTRRFFLYINGKLLTTVDDKNPLPVYNNMAPFVRGSSRCMFENIYALASNYSQNTASILDTPVNSIFDNDEIDTNDSFKKYAMSGIIQGTYLSGINSAQPPEYKIYFDEFGTIMREASLFSIKYDKAYPALHAKLSPTFNRIKGYSVSGFRAGAYGAEFMVFNATDTALNLDSSSGNYLRIQGVTFTQESQSTLSVDDYFSKNSNFSNPTFEGDSLVSSPLKVKKDYQDIKLSRMTYGSRDFSLDTNYIQTQDSANELMKWMVGKIMKPRKSVGLEIFAIPTLQLGDIVSIDYSEKGIDKVGTAGERFVVYNIEYSKDIGGPQMKVYVSEISND